MTHSDWKSIAVREETKEIIDMIAEEEEMTITGVVDSSIRFVHEEFYTQAVESDPQLELTDGRKRQLDDRDLNQVEIEL